MFQLPRTAQMRTISTRGFALIHVAVVLQKVRIFIREDGEWSSRILYIKEEKVAEVDTTQSCKHLQFSSEYYLSILE